MSVNKIYVDYRATDANNFNSSVFPKQVQSFELIAKIREILADEGIDVNGEPIYLDVDQDTYFVASTDDTIDVYVNGAKDFTITANTLTALSGSTIATNTIDETTAASGVTIDGVLLKDSKVTASGGISKGTVNATEFTVLTTLTATEIVGTSAGDLGHASGAVLVAAPGAGFALEFLDAVAIYDFGVAAYTGGGNDTTINIGGGGAAITGVVTSANLLGAAGDKIVRFVPLSTAALPVTENAGISMNSVTAWTQPGTAAGVLRVYTTYRVITTGL